MAHLPNSMIDIQREINAARVAQDRTKLTVLQALKQGLTDAALRKGSVRHPLSDEEYIGVIRSQIKQRNDAAEAFDKAGEAGTERAAKERVEVAILEAYLPAQWSDDDIWAAVEMGIAKVGATTKKDAGKVIKFVMEAAKGKADGKRVSAEVMKALS